MSYAMAAALQAAVYDRLSGDAALAGLVGGAVYDAVPPGEGPGTFVLLGPEEVRDASDRSGAGAEHRFTVSVVSRKAGFAVAKAAAAAISDALLGPPLALARGRVAGLWFLSARARREGAGAVRRIDLVFRARVEG
ncbi:MAG: DUF3168 domain-containing protein [Gemmobacter sp.]